MKGVDFYLSNMRSDCETDKEEMVRFMFFMWHLPFGMVGDEPWHDMYNRDVPFSVAFLLVFVSIPMITNALILIL